MYQYDKIYVWEEWGSSGLWILDDEEPRGVGGNVSYEEFNLPKDLVQRFEYWINWHDAIRPEWSDEKNNFDRFLFDAYGMSLSIDLKRFLGDKHRVFYGTRLDQNCFEVILDKNNDEILVPHRK